MQVDEESGHVCGPVGMACGMRSLECSAFSQRTFGKAAECGLTPECRSRASRNAQSFPLLNPQHSPQLGTYGVQNFGAAFEDQSQEIE